MASKRSIFSKQHLAADGVNQRALSPGDEEPLRESDGGTDSDTETEDDEPVAVAVPPKKPKLGSTRIEAGSGPLEDGSECSSPSASAFIIMPSSKPRETTKKKSAASKKFSEEEEIAMLKGLAVFWANGRNNKWTEFHQFVKDDLPREFTKIQVSEKIRSLKRKYDNNQERARANGGRLDIADHHESVLFKLSERLWGNERGVANVAENGQDGVKIEEKTPLQKDHKNVALKIRNKADNDVSEVREEEKKLKKQKQTMEIGKEEFQSEYPLLCSSFDALGYPQFVKDSSHLMGREKAQELEKKWRELNAEELRLEARRIDLAKKDLLNHHMTNEGSFNVWFL